MGDNRISKVVPKLLFWLLSERLPQHVDKTKHPKVWQAVADVAALYREWCESGTKPARKRFAKAQTDAAYAVAYAAAYAAYAACKKTRSAEFKLIADKLVALLAEAPCA